MPTYIRTIPRSEPNELPVLIRITHSGDTGLDLKLQATEGENKFKGRGKDYSVQRRRPLLRLLQIF